MLADKRCLDCGEYYFGLDDAVGGDLKSGGHDRYPGRGEYYFDVTCPDCGRMQGLVVDTSRPALFTIWPGSWNDETCREGDCEYCEGEYV